MVRRSQGHLHGIRRRADLDLGDVVPDGNRKRQPSGSLKNIPGDALAEIDLSGVRAPHRSMLKRTNIGYPPANQACVPV